MLLTIFVSLSAFADPYSILEVGRQESQDQIRKAYIRLVRVYHENGTNPNPDKLKAVNGAYDLIRTAELRREYDLLHGDPTFSFRPSAERRTEVEETSMQKFREFFQRRLESTLDILDTHGPLAQFFAVFYDTDGKFMGVTRSMTYVASLPTGAMIGQMTKELRVSVLAGLASVEFLQVGGEEAQYEFVRNFFVQEVAVGITNQMESFYRRIATHGEFAELYKLSVAEMFSYMHWACPENLRHCVLQLLDLIDKSPHLYSLIDSSGAQILMALLESVSDPKQMTSPRSEDFKRVQYFRKKLTNSGNNARARSRFLSLCETAIKGLLPKSRR